MYTARILSNNQYDDKSKESHDLSLPICCEWRMNTCVHLLNAQVVLDDLSINICKKEPDRLKNEWVNLTDFQLWYALD